MHNIKTKIPGLAAAMVLAGLAVSVSAFVPWFGSIMLALVLGLVAGNTFLKSDNLQPGLRFSEKIVLEVSIVLLGFGFEANSLGRLDFTLIVFILASIILVLGITVGLGKMLGLSTRLSVLLGAGSAICGSAAIGATAPIIRASDEEVGLSMGVVNLLGVVGLAVLPAITVLLHFTDFESAILLGGTLQSIGHVAASGFAMNELVGEWAMVVKMSRVVFLIPLLIVLFFAGKRAGNKDKVKFPLFIFFFAGAVYLAQFDFFPNQLSDKLASLGSFLMAVAMAAIGVGIRIKPLLKISTKGIALGTIVFVIQILMFVGFVLI
tara:strand:- start:229 stop:1191 length:963 start_codon:yes stop_codon:yes gene_type:complete